MKIFSLLTNITANIINVSNNIMLSFFFYFFYFINIKFSFFSYLNRSFFWNYSYLGVFLGFVFFGLLISWLDKKLRNSNSLSTILILSVFSPFFFIAWRGSYSSQLVYTLFSIMPVLVIILLHKMLKELPIQNNKDI